MEPSKILKESALLVKLYLVVKFALPHEEETCRLNAHLAARERDSQAHIPIYPDRCSVLVCEYLSPTDAAVFQRTNNNNNN